ncbi:acyl-CoA dehydrogenase family protein [Novosphingobium sp.]|uniref:acyl-CoA dehydrogenase family protein n=1 Tax=Novosphingobium sp. TaxID=1874826 RepID=UPI003B51D98F
MDAMELLDPFVRMLDDVASSDAIRTLESGKDIGSVWPGIVQSGYLDALVDEASGGAGLSLAEIAPLIGALGAHALPLPVADTMVARALLAQAGVSAPEGPIVLAPALAQPLVGVLLADHALVDTGDALILSPIAALNPQVTGVHGSLAGWLSGDPQGPVLERPAGGLRPIAAVLRALLMAGAAERLTAMSATYANDRVQFGKPIGRQQALQQMLAVMAEDMVACRIAAQLGASHWPLVPATLAATAKITTSAAAIRIAASAHAVHGAIGISADHDLQLLTRRLHEWRLSDGSEGYWSAVLGEARLNDPASTVDWVRTAIFA